MALVFVLMLTIGIMTVLGIAAIKWGVDSRPTIGDDYARSRGRQTID